MIKMFGWSLALTVLGIVGGFFMGGLTSMAVVAVLIVLEVSLSFDNAVVNATVLRRMNPFWQRIFLTVGVIIAVVGMRLLFPLLIVTLTAGISPFEVVDLALAGGDQHTPGTYAYLLHEAHPSIAAFGGMFLLMLFLDFVFDDAGVYWLKPLERPLAKAGKLDHLPVVVALCALAVAAKTLAEDGGTVLFAGVCGVATYLLVAGLGSLFESGMLSGTGADSGDERARSGANQAAQVGGKAAFFLFMYLEVLDASFSFDGVIGAFAITQDIFVIAIGLGVGAMWIREITVYLVRRGTLEDYVYLENGAMWAIGALAAILIVSIKHTVSEVVTGLIGVTFIAAAFISSIVHNRRREGSGRATQGVND